MEGSCESDIPLRLLGLGNEILADDAFGLRVAAEVARRFPKLDVVCSSSTGLHLLDDILGVQQLLIVDTVMTGDVAPGAIRTFYGGQVELVFGGSPHAIGLFDAIAKARRLGLSVPREVVIIAVEAADCTTVGGPMHTAVEKAIEPVIELIAEVVRKAVRG